jgi:cytochrome c biogenesis protein CcmG, thiol:disulfide interchange protein DsbE
MKTKYMIAGLAGLLTLASFSVKDTLPSVDVKDLDGNTVNFSTVAEEGKITVVSFWATWCTPCIKELEAINEKYETWQTEYNMKLVAVSIDDARNSKKVKPKVLGYGWGYQVLIDENMDLARVMNVNNPPFTFIYDKEGNQVYSHQGYTPGAEDELEAKLKELSGK